MTGSSLAATDLLAPDGVLLLHTIGCSVPRGRDALAQQVYFSWRYVPSLSEIVPVIERRGLSSAISRSCGNITP